MSQPSGQLNDKEKQAQFAAIYAELAVLINELNQQAKDMEGKLRAYKEQHDIKQALDTIVSINDQ